ncbi:MAG: nucleoside-diphosphate kinase [Pseudomonadota bacterium]
MERTLILIKPDAFQRSLVGTVIARLESKGLKIINAKMMVMTDEILENHYSHLANFWFFPELKKFMTSGPVMAMALEGCDCVKTVRTICGTTKGREANPGTIRGDYAMSIRYNLIHASEDLKAAAKELKLFFPDDDFFEYELNNLNSIYGSEEKG